MRSPLLIRAQTLGSKALAVGRAAGRNPGGFLRYVARQATAFVHSQPDGGVEAAITAALEERMRSFMTLPPIALLPSRDLDEICSATEARSALCLREADSSELPPAEAQAIARVTSVLKPALIFEIGTYRGRTTRLLAACSPSAMVHTLDLPPDRMLDGGCFRDSDPDLIGADFGTDPSIRSRIIQHHGDSRDFDFTPFHGRVDLVFVDASHAYEALLNDSKRAFDMVRDGGVVLWDDYHPIHGPGVMRALAEISIQRPALWIKGTRLAIHLAATTPPSS